MQFTKEGVMWLCVALGTTIMYISYIPQLYTLIKRKTSDDISKGSWCLWVTAAVLDTIYAVLLGKLSLIFYSGTELVLTIAVLFLSLYYSSKRRVKCNKKENVEK